MGALTYLAQEPGITIEQLRGPLGRTQSATVRIVDQLVSGGLAERRPGRDGRSVAVHLTTEGAAAAREVLKVRRRTVSTALRALSARDRSTLTGLVETMLTGVTGGVEHGERICRMCDLAACPRRSCPVDIAALQNEAEM